MEVHVKEIYFFLLAIHYKFKLVYYLYENKNYISFSQVKLKFSKRFVREIK